MSLRQKIEIKCTGADLVYIESLSPFQGNLKDLSKTNYEKLKKEILDLGFSEPVSVWKNNNNFFLLNGHQRVRTLAEMKKEGFEIPKIPVNWVEAKDIKEAKKKVLALTSQYGEMTGQGLYEFMNEASINFKEIENSFRFPEINFEQFEAGFIKESLVGDAQKEWQGMPDFNQEDKTAFFRIIVNFKNPETLKIFTERLGIKITENTKSVWFPDEPRMDTESKRYE